MTSTATLPVYFAHPTACIDEPCEIGAGTKIWHFSHISADASIGPGCTLGQNVYVAPRVRIGGRVKIQNNVSIYEGVEIEDDVFCGPSMVFTNVATPRSQFPRNRSEDYVRTLVRRGATIGANATIVCGLTIGAYAFVGAGAVVTRDVPDHALVYGNPARVHGYACRCGIKLNIAADAVACAHCGATFARRGLGLEPVGEALRSS